MMLEDRIKEKIGHNIASDDVVLFMKGTPVFPQCGFSAAVVGVLSHLGIKFSGVNVLDDDEIREGVKAYSDWPAIPSFMRRANLSAAVMLCAKCMKLAS